MIKFVTKISDDSYSVAVASMAEQVLEDLFETLSNIDPSEVQIEGLRKIEFEREGRMKRILDLASIFYDPGVSTTSIRIAMKELKDKDLVIANMRMAGYKKMSPGPDDSNFFVERWRRYGDGPIPPIFKRAPPTRYPVYNGILALFIGIEFGKLAR